MKNQLKFGEISKKMKDKKNIIIVMASFSAVLTCLIMLALLFYSITPSFLIILSLAIGLISGVCMTLLIQNLINIMKIRRSKKI